MSVAGATTVVGYGANDIGNDNTLKPSEFPSDVKGKRRAAGMSETLVFDESITHSNGMVGLSYPCTKSH
jgi:hypothetical protein